jgi:hypothetical protein
VDIASVYAKLQNVYTVMISLQRGRDIDLELLTGIPKCSVKQP